MTGSQVDYLILFPRYNFQHQLIALCRFIQAKTRCCLNFWWSGGDSAPSRPHIGRAALPRSLAEQQLGPTKATVIAAR